MPDMGTMQQINSEPLRTATVLTPQSQAEQYAREAQQAAAEAAQSATDAQTAAASAQQAVAGAVKYSEAQTLTAAQQAQARANIGGGSAEDVAGLKIATGALDNRVSAIEEAEGLMRYGVSGIGQSASALTRIWDSVGMTAQVGTDGDNSNVINDFDHVTPFNRRKCVGQWHLVNGRPQFSVHA